MDRSSRRLRWRQVALALATVAAVLWLTRRPLLVAVGNALVAEDALATVDVIVVSNASARVDALEAARLHGEGISRRLAIPQWVHEPVDAEIKRLGVPYLETTELVRAILERGGVPTDAITIIPGAATGTEDEVAAVVRYAGAARLSSLLYVGPRTHTARVRWLLRRRLPSVRILVRSGRDDEFTADGWWRSREQSRDVMSEYLRWLNSALLGDAWRTASATP